MKATTLELGGHSLPLHWIRILFQSQLVVYLIQLGSGLEASTNSRASAAGTAEHYVQLLIDTERRV